MTRKILKLLLVIAISLSTTGCTQQLEKPVEAKKIETAKVIPQHLKQEQVRVEQIKKTEEGQEIFRLVDIYSKKYGVDKKLVLAIILTESNFKVTATNGKCRGLMQLADHHKKKGYTNLYDKQQNIECGTKHLAGMLARYNGDENLALAGYLLGGGAVRGTVPPSASNYVKKVKERKVLFEGGLI